MTSMIERVARAIYKEHWDRTVCPPLGYTPFAGVEDMMRETARAAILAMREPTEGMVHSGAQTRVYVCDQLTAAQSVDNLCKNTWISMIDAALQEKPDDRAAVE